MNALKNVRTSPVSILRESKCELSSGMVPTPTPILGNLPPYRPDARDDDDPLAPPPELRQAAYELTSETYDSRQSALREIRQRVAEYDVEQQNASRGEKSQVIVDHTEDKFLLMFLRAKKFRVPLAAQELFNFYQARTDNPWLREVDIALVERLFSSGAFQVLPRQDRRGRVILSMNLKALGPLVDEMGKNRAKDLLSAIFAMLLTVAENVRAQILGVVIIADLTTLRLRTFGCLSAAEYVLSLNLCQHCYPLRARGMYLAHEPWFVKGLFNVMLPFMKSTVKEHLRSVGNDVDKIHKYIPKESLPRTFGGDLVFDEALTTKQWVEAVRKRTS